jgi:hypothetical protein
MMADSVSERSSRPGAKEVGNSFAKNSEPVGHQSQMKFRNDTELLFDAFLTVTAPKPRVNLAFNEIS